MRRFQSSKDYRPFAIPAHAGLIPARTSLWCSGRPHGQRAATHDLTIASANLAQAKRTPSRSSAPERMHDLYTIRLLQHVRRVQAARNDAAVDFDRDTSITQSFAGQQGQDRRAAIEDAFFAIELDSHGRIVPWLEGSDDACDDATIRVRMSRPSHQ